MRMILSLMVSMLAVWPAWTAPRNIIVIVTDDQSPDFGCYGNTALKTPNLDRLAAEGTRFRHAFATTASCSASRSILLTGMHNHANGHYGHAHAYHKFNAYPNVKSLPVRLAGAGYRTALCGKLHVEPEAVFHFDQVVKANPRNTMQMAEQCKSIFAAKSDQPFFLYFCPTDPHRDGQVIADDPLQPNSFGNRPKGYPGVKEVRYDPKDVVVPSFLPDSPTCRAELAQYYQSVSRLDQGVGRLVELLKEAGKYDETMIVFMADHGMAFPGAKTTVYEPGLHIPLIVRHPAAKQRGIVNEALVSIVDLTPTLLDFAGALPADAKFHGRSFLPILEEAKPKDWDVVYASHTFHEITMYYPMRAVRDRQYKLIWNIAHPLPFPFASDLWEAPTWQERFKQGPQARYGKRSIKEYIQRPKFELYDLQADPDEVVNRANDPQYAKVLERMKDQLKVFQKRTEDPWILKWDYE